MNRHIIARRRRRERDDGAAAVEFALVVPFLVMLVFGIISFGIIFAQHLSLGNAARQGARFGVVGDRTCGEITTETKTASQTIALASTNVDVEVTLGMDEATAEAAGDVCGSVGNEPCTGSQQGENLYVKAKFNSELVIPFAVYEPTFPVTGIGVFRCEFS